MRKRSGMVWVPASVLEEVEDLCAEHKIPQRSKGFERLVSYSKVGREVERIATFRFWSGKH